MVMYDSTTIQPWETITGDTGIDGYDDELTEELKSMRNRCDAILWLLENPNAFYTINTLLEDLFEKLQMVVEDYCIDD